MGRKWDESPTDLLSAYVLLIATTRGKFSDIVSRWKLSSSAGRGRVMINGRKQRMRRVDVGLGLSPLSNILYSTL